MPTTQAGHLGGYVLKVTQLLLPYTYIPAVAAPASSASAATVAVAVVAASCAAAAAAVAAAPRRRRRPPPRRPPRRPRPQQCPHPPRRQHQLRLLSVVGFGRSTKQNYESNKSKNSKSEIF